MRQKKKQRERLNYRHHVGYMFLFCFVLSLSLFRFFNGNSWKTYTFATGSSPLKFTTPNGKFHFFFFFLLSSCVLLISVPTMMGFPSFNKIERRIREKESYFPLVWKWLYTLQPRVSRDSFSSLLFNLELPFQFFILKRKIHPWFIFSSI